jgi:hypothetical protein
MSQSTTNNAYMEKSMNGIITIDDGAGGTMEGGVITCNELDVPTINCNEVQPYNVSSAYNLFTNATADINMGNVGVTTYMLSPIVSTTAIIAGQFNAPLAYLNNIESVTINTSTLNVSNVNVSTVTVNTENVTTLNVSTINTNLINSFDTALPSYLFPNALTDVSIADGLTSGILSMGSLLQVGEINIGGHNNFGGSINIGREMNGGTMRFASNAQATSIFWGNDANTGTVNFNTNTSMNLGPYAKTITIGSNQFLSTDRINIGNGTTGSASMNLLCRNTINIGLNASSIQIGNTMSTGNINLGSNAITTTIKGATINVGTDTSINAINLGNVSTTLITVGNSAANIQIGTGTSVTNTITIGNASSTVNISGSASIRGNTYTATAVGSTVNLFNNITTGSLNMATSITNGNILIGNHSTIGATGSLTLRAKNSVEIGSAAASIYLGIGSPSINIGNSCVGGTPTIEIGTTALSTTNINGNFGVAIKPTYAYTAFVGTPTGCIGNFFIPSSAIAANFALTSGTNKVGGIFANIAVGVWMLYWNCAVFCPTTVANLTSITLLMGTTSGGSDLFSGVVDVGNVPVGITKTYLITQIYSNTNATTDLYFSITAVFAGTLTLLPLYTIKECKVLRLA